MRWKAETRRRLLAAAVFALAFAWIEAVVVVYLRKLIGLEGTLDALDPATQRKLFGDFAVLRSAGEGGHQSPVFLLVEQTREAATILVLLAVGWLAGSNLKSRAAYFFYCFGIWDIAYYAVLWLLLRWPPSPATVDVLFLIPFPWIANVWIPAAISVLFVAGGVWALGSPAARRRAR